jgi:hypothetical protein
VVSLGQSGPGLGRLAMTLRLRAALLLGLLVAPAPAPELAHAQDRDNGWGQSVLGNGWGPVPSRQPWLSFRYAPYFAPHSPYRIEEELRPASRPSTYRTLCVRLCDGYYFPISAAATQDTLVHDAEMCSASCGSEARLFYHASGGGDAGSAIDLTGMAYSALPNAFKYRKALVENCRCRPQPWSETELARHRAYAQGQSRPPPEGSPERAGIGSIEVIAGDYTRGSIVPLDGDRAVPRPDPALRNIEPILPERSLAGAARSELPDGSHTWRPHGRRH